MKETKVLLVYFLKLYLVKCFEYSLELDDSLGKLSYGALCS